MKLNEIVGNIIQEQRVKEGIKQEVLAKNLPKNNTQGHLSEMEKGKVPINFDEVESLSPYLPELAEEIAKSLTKTIVQNNQGENHHYQNVVFHIHLHTQKRKRTKKEDSKTSNE